MLVEVYDRGGHYGLAVEELAAVGMRHGYDRRGLGGFFTGGRAPLTRSDNHVYLTTQGEELMDAFLTWVPA